MLATNNNNHSKTMSISAENPRHKMVIRKSFRLFDFQFYDEKPSADDADDDNHSDDGEYRPKKYTVPQFVIQMFGVNERGETCCLYINDYQPFFFVKIGDRWGDSEVRILLEEIKSKLDKFTANSIVSAELVEHYKLYGFSAGKKYRFAKLVFKNLSTMNRVKSLWYFYPKDSTERKRIPFIFRKTSIELYESNIPPLLRYFHIHNISPSGWVSFKMNRVVAPSIKTTTCTHEFICSLKELQPMPEKETRVPYKICSFDIEASSSHGDFPIPVKTYKRLATQTVDVYIKQSTQQLTADKMKALLQKAILTAFGHDKFDDVDLVFPKSSPSLPALKRLISVFLNENIETAKQQGDSVEEKSRLLKINEAFEKQLAVAAKYGDDDEADGDEAAGGGDEDGEAAEDDDEAVAPPPPRKSVVAAENKKTIIDVLMGDKYNREDKIRILNDTMTLLFPSLKGDEVTFIGSTFMRYGETEPYKNHCVVLGSCDPVDGAIIETAETERDVLLKWKDLMHAENPDIIIGYNIFGFDYEFMFRRAQETGCEREFLCLSRKRGELCAKINRNDPADLQIENTKLKIASGEYDLRYFKMTGRLQIDMYAYFRRDFNLSSYKLDDVAGQYIGDTIQQYRLATHASFGEVTELYSQNLTGLHVGDYIHIEITGFTSDYYKKGHKFSVVHIDHARAAEDGKTYNVIVIRGHEDLGTAKLSWGTAKDDVSPQDIFRLSNGSSADRAVVAKYCIQDCNLVHHLMNKIDVITGYVEMARICSVPINFLVFRGQGIKLTSFVAKKCREKNTLMPDIEKTEDSDGYEGAIVLPPKCSMYMDNPVACVDYSSLYPSAMISQNYSHDSQVWTKEYNLGGDLVSVTGERDSNGRFIYDNLPEYQYIDVEFDTFKYIRKNKTSRAEKTKVGKIICRWAQLPSGQKSIMPSILEELLKARSDTRKMIKTEKDPFMQNILDKRQLGYKVTANSLYGQCGSRTSTFYQKNVAASTTATGRMMIIYAKRMIEEVYGDLVYDTEKHGPVLTKAEYVYGDSVASYTPVYMRANGFVEIRTIEELAAIYGGGRWSKCAEPGKQEKEFCELSGVETWSDGGWTKLYRVIRHTLAAHKKMIRVMTHTGLVDVTDDHSLLTADGTEISPKDVHVGDELMHAALPGIERGGETGSSITARDAEITGLFFGDKHCGMEKIIPGDILNGNEEIRAAFWKGVCSGEATTSPTTSPTTLKIYQNTQIGASHIAFLAATMGWKSTVHFQHKPNSAYVINITKTKTGRKSKSAVKKMEEIQYDGYVYDLTTENHHFAAGIGNLIVHNTDSVFFTFNLEDPKTGEKIRGKEALEITIEIAQDVAHLCSQWLKAPMELSYEKTLMPFILLSKKRYVGILYETDANKGKLKYMGLSLKRRDSCDYLKDVYGGILNILMKGQGGIPAAIEFLGKSLADLVDGKVDIDKLTITKALRSDYKNPNQIGHKVLADRIGQRDPGNKPKSGERIRFVFVCTNQAKALMGDKIETPEFISANRLKIDYTHYITNQLMKPLQQLFGLAIEQIWTLQNKSSPLKMFKIDVDKLQIECGNDLELYMKKREKLCSSKVKTLLFDPVLDKIYNEKNRIQPITAFFAKNK
jgi:DNA polymerase elongation subunit (family B)